MPIQIETPIFIYEKGKRKNNEDYVFPLHPTPSTRLFLVADGVGGLEKGEVASQLMCNSFHTYYQQHPVEMMNADYLKEAIGQIQQEFTDYVENNPQAIGMATTFTLLHLHNNGATVAHIGDSRVYQFRNGAICFQTKDDSVVQDLVTEGVISEAEMATHPQRNIITKAVQASTEGKVQASVQQLTDLQINDYFLLCTDGLLEAWSAAALADLLTDTTTSLLEKKEKLSQRCKEMSKDNFSAYLIQIAQGKTNKTINNADKTTVHSSLRIVPIIILIMVVIFGLKHCTGII